MGVGETLVPVETVVAFWPTAIANSRGKIFPGIFHVTRTIILKKHFGGLKFEEFYLEKKWCSVMIWTSVSGIKIASKSLETTFFAFFDPFIRFVFFDRFVYQTFRFRVNLGQITKSLIAYEANFVPIRVSQDNDFSKI